jgi:hypothetical protein
MIFVYLIVITLGVGVAFLFHNLDHEIEHLKRILPNGSMTQQVKDQFHFLMKQATMAIRGVTLIGVCLVTLILEDNVVVFANSLILIFVVFWMFFDAFMAKFTYNKPWWYVGTTAKTDINLPSRISWIIKFALFIVVSVLNFLI